MTTARPPIKPKAAYMKFGVRIWPEILPELGIDPAELKPGFNPIMLHVLALMGDKGPRKGFGLAKVTAASQPRRHPRSERRLRMLVFGASRLYPKGEGHQDDENRATRSRAGWHPATQRLPLTRVSDSERGSASAETASRRQSDQYSGHQPCKRLEAPAPASNLGRRSRL